MLDELKDILNIDWDSEDVHLMECINRAKSKVKSLLGVPFDEKNSEQKELALNYARYAYNNVPELFEENFKSEIMRNQFKAGVNELEKKEQGAKEVQA